MQSPTGMRAFVIVWLGQVVSQVGTNMTLFGVTIWAWERTGEATTLALVGFCAFAPSVIFSPIAGALVDRWNRKLVMMLSDLASGLSTVVLLLLYTSGNLQIWHLCVAGAFNSTFLAFQFPAYSAAVTTMLAKGQYVRAHAMLGLAESAATVAAPLLAGFLLGIIHLNGIMTIDVVTFVVAVGALLFVHIPQPPVSEAGRTAQGSLFQESIYGFRYIFARPSLLGLQLVFFAGNLISIIAYILFAPMILSRTGNDEIALGTVQTAFGVGGIIGGLILSAWGGPKRKALGVLGGWSLLGVATVLLGIGQTLPVWIAAAFITYIINPAINASNQGIWQAKVAPDIQGRVFAARRLISQITVPLGMALAGPLADRVFEPGMMAGGALAATFGGLVGTGPGAGMGLMVAISGVLVAVVGLAGMAVRPIRDIESLLPDHDTTLQPTEVIAAEASA